jgi:hypothetical protein
MRRPHRRSHDPRPPRRLARLALGAALLPCLAAIPSTAGASVRAAHPDASRPAAAGRVVFVATDGDDRGSGDRRHPLATIQTAVDRVRGGGTVQLLGGIYAQQIALRHARHVTVEPYRGQRVILDGGPLTVPDGRSAMVLIDDSTDVTVEGLDITGYRTASMQATPIGIFVHGGDRGVVLRDNHIHDMGNDNQTQGNFDSNALGIAVYGDSAAHPVSDLLIAHNTVDHIVTGASETITLNGNVDGWRVLHNHVYNDDNIGIDAIGYEPTLPGRYRYTDRNRARHGVIADNVVHHIYSSENPAYRLSYHGKSFDCNCADGVYVDGGSHIVIERNQIDQADIGIEVASEHPQGEADHVTVRDNFVWDSKATGISTGGYCDGHADCGGGGLARSGQGVTTGQAFDNTFINNTLYDNNTLHDGSPQFLVQYYVHDSRIENNIIIAGPGQRQGLGTVPRAARDGRNTGDVVDHNLYWATDAGAGKVGFGWQGTTYPSFRSYQAHTGQDAHSRFADPRLVSLALRNLHLQAGSPAIGTGLVPAGGLAGRFDVDHQPRLRGGAIDIGADERWPAGG